MKKNSNITIQTMRVMYPYIIIFGIYIIFNGHTSPGGGFQGGAILSSVFIIHYLISPKDTFSLHFLSVLEKVFFLTLTFLLTIFTLYYNNQVLIFTKQVYMIAMNILIGLEVFCGFSVIFFRFIHFESR